MMEPVAAAFAYISSDPREDITALTYDLGGGTFDVTVLERRDGIIMMKAFDGNHLLGGYNFDKRFVAWLLGRVKDRLKDSGRTFVLDENNESDQSSWSQLLQLAERVKQDLVLKPTAKVATPIKGNNILHDTDGKPIPIIDKINREEYTALIQDLLDDTIEKSRQAMNKAEIKDEDLDVIVLVGGSSYGQWVMETVKRAFPNNKILLSESPDFCVAAGAAIFAQNLPFTNAKPGAEFEILVDVPRSSLFSTLTVIGTVQKFGLGSLDPRQRESLRVILDHPESGETAAISLNEDGNFIFQDVELLEGEPTNLNIRLIDSESRERGILPLCIDYNPDGGVVTPPLQSVPKPIYLRTGSELVTIAKEAERLPVKSREIKLKKINDDPIIYLDVYQDTDLVTTIKVEGLPDDAGEVSSVFLTMEITKQNLMRGTVVVKRPDGSLATEWPVEIPFPPLQIPSLPELKDVFQHLDAKREQEIYLEKDPARRTMLGGKGEKIAKKIRNLFAEQFSDLQEIYQAIKELEVMLAPEKDDMQPPMEDFQSNADECRRMIAESDSEQSKQHFDTLERIEKDASDARMMKDKRKWSTVNEQLKKLISKLRPKVDENDERDLPTTDELKDMFHDEIVENLRVALSAKIQSMQSMKTYDSTKHGTKSAKIERSIVELQERIRAIDDNIEPKKALLKQQSIAREKPRIMEIIRRLDLDTVIGNIDSNRILQPVLEQRIGIPEMPVPTIDSVQFSVSSPHSAQPGQKFIVDVWAHIEKQRAEVIRRIKQASLTTDSSTIIRPKGPFKIERGTTLFVRLKFPGLRIKPPEDFILWEGEIGNASFEVAIPSEISEGVKIGLATVHWEGGLQIARIPLQLLVAARAVPVTPTIKPLYHIKKAFASYASQDRDEVIGRIQGMQKIAPDLDVFLDVVKLRSGQDWESELWRVIPESDVFYLFWSAAAKASPWVEKEWRCALNSRGEEFIDPVPLVSPNEVSPPDELSKKHFNDWILAFRSGKPKSN